MTRFSVSGNDDENNDDVGSSRLRVRLLKRPRTATTLHISTFSRSPLAAAIRRADGSPYIRVEEDSTDESNNSSSRDTNSSTSDSEQPENPNPVLPENNEVVPIGGNGNNSESGLILSDTDVLDCPICLDPLSIPVFQCENGHLACGTCCNKIRNKCPSCVMPIGYNRCRGMEKVLESVKTSCPNWKHGCVQKISYCQKLDHEKSCKYAPCSCPKDGCNYVDISTGLYHHVFVRHATTNFSFNTMKLVDLFKHNPDHIVLQEGKQRTVFVLNHVIEPLGSLINVMCVSSPSSNMKYSYELTAALDGNLIKLESSVAVSQKFIVQSPMKKFLLVTSDFFDGDGKLSLELIIKKRLN